MRRTPLTYDEPQERRDRAASHWCEAVGSRLYCLSIECPYCDDEEQEQEVDA